MTKEKKFVTPDVNLLPEDDLEQRPGGKFLKWALSWGKKIVILTELIVVLAFLSRFKLDSDVANYSEEIDRRKTIILASQNFEQEFRTTQEKVNKVKAALNTPSLVTIYDTVQDLVPSEVTTDQIGIVDTKVSIAGTGEDAYLSQMVNSFKGSPDFSDVILEKVTKEGESLDIEFSMTAVYTKGEVPGGL